MSTPRAPGRVAGMSLIELMVGMLIGLIGIIIITHLYLTNEQYKRSTTGAGTAQVNGAIALYTLERDARMGGFGFNHSGALGCTCAGAGCSPVQYWNGGAYSFPPAGALGTRPALVLAPVEITSAAGAAATITVLYSNDAERALPGSLSESMALVTSDFKMDGIAGFEIGNLLVVAQGASCMLTQITAPPAASSLQHAAATWNPGAGSLLPIFTQGALLFNLGNPTWRRYSIASNKLQVGDVLTLALGGASTPIVDDIVDLQAQYGKDTTAPADGVVDIYDNVQPANSADWQQVLAIRVGILARSPNYVTPAAGPGNNCDATTAQPTWAGGAFQVKNFTTVTSQDRCYKYRVFETVIPLRNMIWRPA